MPRNAHIAIMVAASNGKGLRLTADEVWQLARDEAIGRFAWNSLGKDDVDAGELPGPLWRKIDPSRNRVAANRGGLGSYDE